ncbi:MAG TPA: hypothetical protein DEQ14_11580 [Treponema sp.]|nr:hypothetical protein [Treponema sp.]
MKIPSGRDWTKDSPYHRFFDFIAPEADRYQIITELLDELTLNSLVISIEEKRHFFVFPKGFTLTSQKSFPFSGQSPVILVAHYDRAEGSSGANDNSAAVFQLLKAATRLESQGADYWLIIFTDKEELRTGESIREQGAFSLAEKLRDWGLGNARIFIFDACGTGDTFIFSKTTDYLLGQDERRASIKAKQLINGLQNHALDTARFLRLSRILVAPTPFSDDAGFLRAGIPAQTITMLPTREAAPYASLLRNRPLFAELLIYGEAQNGNDRLLIPETWRCLNGPSDSHLRLTPEHYDKVSRFAAELCIV